MSDTKKPNEELKAFCFKCNKHQAVIDPIIKTTVSGRTLTSSVCPECHGKLGRFVSANYEFTKPKVEVAPTEEERATAVLSDWVEEPFKDLSQQALLDEWEPECKPAWWCNVIAFIANMRERFKRHGKGIQ